MTKNQEPSEVQLRIIVGEEKRRGERRFRINEVIKKNGISPEAETTKLEFKAIKLTSFGPQQEIPKMVQAESNQEEDVYNLILMYLHDFFWW